MTNGLSCHTLCCCYITSITLRDTTASTERHQHRKHLAMSFSMKNLEYTQTVIKSCLQKFGNILQQQATANTPLMLDSAMIKLTLDIITESSFGINFNSMVPGEDNKAMFYMEENELFLKEGHRSLLNPLRKYMFWDATRKRAQVAKTRLMDLAQSLIDEHRRNTAVEEDG